MKNLIIITRGCPGSGKDTFIDAAGWRDYTITPDDIRNLYRNPSQDEYGRLSRSMENDRKVWSLCHELVEERMKKDDFILFNSTMTNHKNMLHFLKLSKLYNYEVVVLDFVVDLETLIHRNKSRKYPVPLEYLESSFEKMSNRLMNKGFKTLNSSDYINYSEGYFEVDHNKLQNDIYPNLYTEIKEGDILHIVGDIQGCYEPLSKYLDDILPLKDNEKLIFLGDLLDRGPDNDKVLDRCIKLSREYPDNIYWILGNHETHYIHWAYGVDVYSKEFMNRTRPQIEKLGYTKSEHIEFASKFKYIHLLSEDYSDPDSNKIIFTHAGLSDFIFGGRSHLYSQYRWFFSKGAGKYAAKVDEMFNHYTHNEGLTNSHLGDPLPLYQFHGHRNKDNFNNDVENCRSFNLEGGVEFNGELRTAKLVYEKYAAIQIDVELKYYPYIRENIHDPYKQCEESNKYSDEQYAVKYDDHTKLYSINTNRKVFNSGAWNRDNVKARSLFLYSDGTVAARAYDKTFNLDEIKSTSRKTLDKKLKYPLIGKSKYNGFLGILSYHKEFDDFIFCTKSTSSVGVHHCNGDSEYMAYYKNMFNKSIPENVLDKLKSIIKDNNISVTFEIVDNENDPHIADDETGLYLLDAIKNSEIVDTTDMNLYGIDELIGEYVKIAKPMPVKNRESLYKIINKMVDTHNVEFRREGFMITDQNGFVFKLKSKFYTDWKEIRNIRDRILRDENISIEKLHKQHHSEIVKDVTRFLHKNKELAHLSIPKIRQIYEHLSDIW